MWESTRQRWITFTIEQKLSVVILIFCGFFAIGLSLFRIQTSVRAPFLVDKGEVLATKKLVGPSPEEDQARLQRLDTDGDGLSDWDELNVYHTNPNLRDTCGDGVSDNVRVVTGKNLNCKGQQMNQGGMIDLSQVSAGAGSLSLPTGSVQEPAAPPALDVSGLMQAVNAASSTSTSAPAPTDGGQVLPPRDPQAIRDALKGRIDAAQLQKISDADLLKMYDESANQLTQSQSSNSATLTNQP